MHRELIAIELEAYHDADGQISSPYNRSECRSFEWNSLPWSALISSGTLAVART